MANILVCAGQGSQKPAMAEELYFKSEEFKKIIDDLSQTTKYPLIELLTTTKYDINELGNTQIAVAAYDYALGKILKQEIDFDYYYGLSLGEIPALALNGVINEKDLLPLIEKRIEAMNRSLDDKSAMLAVVSDQHTQIIDLASKFESVYPANFNSNNQIVVSGDIKQIEQFKDELTKINIKRAIQLNVKGPFHTPLMEKSAQIFEEDLKKFDFKQVDFKTYSNYSAQLYTFDSIITNLSKHISNVVKFKDITNKFTKEDNFYEVGPVKILSKLIKDTNDASVTSINTIADLNNIKGDNNGK